MGREIRRVPANWEHPRWTEEDSPRAAWVGEFKSMHDETYEQAATEWLDALAKWEAGENPDREKYGYRYIWDWEGNPPDKHYYRPEFESEPTWFQLYETVSEGSPVTPPFATEDELIDYLCTEGDSWCQKRTSFRDPIPTRDQATALVKSGYAPSMVVANGKIMGPAEAAEFCTTEPTAND